MAIRRPPTTFSDSITGADLANDIAISTTGNIATTGSGTLTVAGNTTLSGTNNLGSNPTLTLGSNATFPSEFPTFIKAFDSGSAAAQINSGSTTNTTGVNFGSSMSFTFPANSTAVIQSIGGEATARASALRLSHLGHAYKSGSDFSSSTDGSFLWSGYARSDSSDAYMPASASSILTNSGSETTYYIRLAVRTHNNGYNARWISTGDQGGVSARNRIITTIMVYKT